MYKYALLNLVMIQFSIFLSYELLVLLFEIEHWAGLLALWVVSSLLNCFLGFAAVQ